jgi:DNA-directed RNA polymerase subunit omega
MARITVEDCLQYENNRFALVLLASKRAKQLLSGASALISESKNKSIVTSLREIAAHKVRFMTQEEQLAAEAQRASEAEAAKKARQDAAAASAASVLSAPEKAPDEISQNGESSGSVPAA